MSKGQGRMTGTSREMPLRRGGVHSTLPQFQSRDRDLSVKLGTVHSAGHNTCSAFYGC